MKHYCGLDTKRESDCPTEICCEGMITYGPYHCTMEVNTRDHLKWIGVPRDTSMAVIDFPNGREVYRYQPPFDGVAFSR